ncbi:MAG: lamin tail domain-containing protein [Candidatus Azobacteroides sp.]|nr:lamin tail domain-containing protein [Candidatus Azobacteroides sp.]
MNKRYLSLIGMLILLVTGIRAQTTSDLRLNELLPLNVDNYEDDFGIRSAWIEIFNTSYSTVDIGGCFLTNDIKEPTKYRIPKGDVLTKIKPRQHVLFWADNKPVHGTFHVNFTLSESNFVALFASDGKTLIDSIRFPEPVADVSYGRLTDGGKKWASLDRTTPNSTNTIVEPETENNKLLEKDPIGIVMSVTAMSVVFIALALLFLIFKIIGKNAIVINHKRAVRAAVKQEKYNKPPIMASGQESGEICAAIVFAIDDYLKDEHDIENTILTITKVARTYSPWSSKIYNLRQFPR